MIGLSSMEPNDTFLLKTIVGYCEDVLNAIERFSLDEKVVTDDVDLRAILSFFVLQIGETASKLSDTFKASHPEIEWRAIIGLRHRIVHAYGKVIPAILWDAATNDIPELRSYCINVLEHSKAA